MGEPKGTGIAGLHSQTAADPGIGDAEERPTTMKAGSNFVHPLIFVHPLSVH